MNGEFREELQHLLNKHSLESDSDTPDYVLARYLVNCLSVFNEATRAREEFYGRGAWPTARPRQPERSSLSLPGAYEAPPSAPDHQAKPASEQ